MLRAHRATSDATLSQSSYSAAATPGRSGSAHAAMRRSARSKLAFVGDGRPAGDGFVRPPGRSPGPDRPGYRSGSAGLGADDDSRARKADRLEPQTAARGATLSSFG